MIHQLPELRFKKNELSPVISEKTIDFHYGKHHQAYVNNLNNLIKNTEFEQIQLDEIVKKAEGGIYNNAAQVWNHTFYFNQFKANGKIEPSGKLLQKLNEDFGSFQSFKENFAKSAATLFGSGWAWLVLNSSGKLEIIQSSNADNPLRKGLKPIFTCDVWEHAYYLDYQNRRPDYIVAFWKIIDWAVIEERF